MNCSTFKTSRNQLIKIHHMIRSSAFTSDILMNSSNILELKNVYISVLYTNPSYMYRITLYNIVIKHTWLYFYILITDTMNILLSIGNVVAKFQVEWINIQGQIASDKKLDRIIRLKNQAKLNIYSPNKIRHRTFQ